MLTLTEEQVRNVQIAAGLKWPGVRDAMGLPPEARLTEAPEDDTQPITTYDIEEQEHGKSEDGQVPEGGQLQAEQGSDAAEVPGGPEAARMPDHPHEGSGWMPQAGR